MNRSADAPRPQHLVGSGASGNSQFRVTATPLRTGTVRAPSWSGSWPVSRSEKNKELTMNQCPTLSPNGGEGDGNPGEAL